MYFAEYKKPVFDYISNNHCIVQSCEILKAKTSDNENLKFTTKR